MYQILQCKIEVNLFFIRFHFLLSYCRPTSHWANAMMKAHVHGHCLSLMQCEASSASPSEYIGCKLVSHLPRLAAVPLLLTVLMALCLPYFSLFCIFFSILQLPPLRFKQNVLASYLKMCYAQGNNSLLSENPHLLKTRRGSPVASRSLPMKLHHYAKKVFWIHHFTLP